MFIAILFVTVLVDDDETAVDERTVPLTVGSVNVGVPATAGAEIVACPLVDPAKIMSAMLIL